MTDGTQNTGKVSGDTGPGQTMTTTSSAPTPGGGGTTTIQTIHLGEPIPTPGPPARFYPGPIQGPVPGPPILPVNPPTVSTPVPPKPPVGGPPITNQPLPMNGGGCPCPGGDGGGGGGGSGGSLDNNGNPCPPIPVVCRLHDGSVVLKNNKQPLTADAFGAYHIPGVPDECGGYLVYDNIPYCDDLPNEPCPEVKKADQCCSDAFKAIAEAMKYIADKLSSKISDNCADSEDCLNKLAQKLKDKILPPAKTCEECCKRVELGIGEKASCAATIANCTCQSCVDTCESYDEGQCCKGCGKSKCTCKDRKCVPDETESEYWQAFCNRVTGEKRNVNQAYDGVPGDDWDYIGEFPSESEAASANTEYCQPTSTENPPRPSPPILPPFVLPGGIMEGVCETSRYNSRLSATAALQRLPTPNLAVKVISAVGNAFNAIGNSGGNAAGMIAGVATAGGQALVGSYLIELAADVYASASGFAPNALEPAMQTFATLGLMENMTGISIPQVRIPLDYALNAATRPRLFSPDQAISAWISATLPGESVDRYFAAAGYCEGISSAMMQSARAKYVPGELARLRRRKMIGESEFATGMRQLGYVNPSEPEALFKLTEYLPGPGDIVSFMRRDVDDPKIVGHFKLDDQFDDKFAGRTKELAAFQGISDEDMKRYWRAHWEIPSPTALREMLHRLRTSDVPDNAKVTIDDIKTALVQQDIAPFWVDKYIEISYVPLGRIDIRRSYNNGTLSDDDTKLALTKLGYSDSDVDKQFKSMQRMKEQAALTHRAIKKWVALIYNVQQTIQEMETDGYSEDQISKAMDANAARFASSVWAKAYLKGEITKDMLSALLLTHGVSDKSTAAVIDNLSYLVHDTETVKTYLAGNITRQTASDRMSARGMQESSVQFYLENADDKFNANHAQECRNFIRKRFALGDITAEEAKAKLLSNGIVSEYADKLIDRWKCLMSNKDKAVSANILCNWYSRGSIDSEQFVSRLVRIGYTQDNALNLVQDCAERLADKQAKADAKRQREEASNKSKAEAAARRNAARANKLAADLESARKTKNALRSTRQAQQLTTQRNLIKQYSCSDTACVEMFTQNKDLLTKQFGLTEDESLRILLKASELPLGGEQPAYANAVQSLAKSVGSTEGEYAIPEP